MIIAVSALGAYLLFVRWLIFWRGDFRTVYVGWIAMLLRWRGMEAITLGPTCCLAQRGFVLSPDGIIHERTHLAQQRAHWWFFFPRYIVLALVLGYRNEPDEVAARKAAGEL